MTLRAGRAAVFAGAALLLAHSVSGGIANPRQTGSRLASGRSLLRQAKAGLVRSSAIQMRLRSTAELGRAGAIWSILDRRSFWASLSPGSTLISSRFVDSSLFNKSKLGPVLFLQVGTHTATRKNPSSPWVCGTKSLVTPSRFARNVDVNVIGNLQLALEPMMHVRVTSLTGGQDSLRRVTADLPPGPFLRLYNSPGDLKQTFWIAKAGHRLVRERTIWVQGTGATRQRISETASVASPDLGHMPLRLPAKCGAPGRH
jgi:hypothetical protein